MVKRWHVAKTKPRKESWLISSLEQLGVEVYFPKIVTRRRGKQINEPLFPTYLFCSFDPDNINWPAVRWAPGLNYFLGVDGRPSAIPDEVVDLIMARSGDFDLCSNMIAGQRVQVVSGPFEGLEGMFQQRLPSKQRCRILVQVIGRLSPVEIADSSLVAAGSPW